MNKYLEKIAAQLHIYPPYQGGLHHDMEASKVHKMRKKQREKALHSKDERVRMLAALAGTNGNVRVKVKAPPPADPMHPDDDKYFED